MPSSFITDIDIDVSLSSNYAFFIDDKDKKLQEGYLFYL